MIEVKGFPAGVFYLSEKKAAERLGTAKKTAGAKLGDLRKLWIISIKKKGTNGKIASERLATTYDWLLSRSHLDQLSENKEPDASLLDRLT